METVNASQLLIAEHDLIKKTETMISRIKLLWEKDSEKYKTIVLRLVYFFKEYSDKYHHYKEEEILFPEMINHSDFKLVEIIEELEDHHVIFREYTQQITLFVQQNRFEEAQKILEKYVDNLLDHIAIEDNELFGMAEALFSPDEYEKIYLRYKDIDAALGDNKKLELEKIPEQLLALLNQA